MIIQSSFVPAWWLSNAHAQTVFPTLTRRLKPPPLQHERLELPDSDFVDLAWASQGLDASTPLVILLHGLGGSINSTYVAGLLHAFNRAGWRGVLMHFRGASEEANRLPRAYHSGDTDDFKHVLKVLSQREPLTPKAAVGISLGGNVLLKSLGELQSLSPLCGAVAVSVPFQLNIVADRVNQGFSRFYQSYLIGRLKKIFLRKWQTYPEQLPLSFSELESLQCFWTFDDKITAPLNGFPHVHAYYRAASSRQYLKNIQTPTLIIHALDDPFMTPDVIPEAHELSASTKLEISRQGGHVGFISGHVPGLPCYWLDERVPAFLRSCFEKNASEVVALK